jgi:hypothetical protein
LISDTVSFFPEIRRESQMAKKKAAKKKKSSTRMDSVREIAQTVLPGAKKRQARRTKRRTAVKKLITGKKK